MSIDTQRKKERAFLFSVALSQDTSEAELQSSLEELAELVSTAGADVVGEMSQRRPQIDPAYRMGRGKLDELKNYVDELEVDLVVSDDELSPSQLRNLEEYLDCAVLDRSHLILDIFAQRAISHEGRLQVELAQLRYMLPRLRQQKGSLSRLAGGIGTRGPGESQLETDRRHIRRRITQLEKQLSAWSDRRQRQNQRRKNTLTIAIVGYTNAGKSSLINRLSKSELYVEDQLFATLDAHLRRIYMPQVPVDVLLSDTVGFIRKLPHMLIDAFKSTLEVVAEADLLLHVIDASDPEAAEQLAASQAVLAEIGADRIPCHYAINKIDLLMDGEAIDPELMPSLRSTSSPDEVHLISARSGEGVEALRDNLEQACLKILEQRKVIR